MVTEEFDLMALYDKRCPGYAKGDFYPKIPSPQGTGCHCNENSSRYYLFNSKIQSAPKST